MPELYHTLSALQNASRARHALCPIPYTKMNQSVLEVLRKEGMVGGVMRGQVRGPFSVCRILLSSSGSEVGGRNGESGRESGGEEVTIHENESVRVGGVA